jgi:cation transport ATPase
LLLLPEDDERRCVGIEADFSALTGESRPVIVRDSEFVYAGGLNLSDGPVLVHATSSGQNSQISQLLATVRRAMAEKPKLQRFADSAASLLVCVALFTAMFSFLYFMLVPVSRWARIPPSLSDVDPRLVPFLVAGSVLSSACPCSFALAIPLVILIGSTAAARHGIFICLGTALETAGQSVYTVVLDKTGTLTSGNMSVTGVTACGGHPWVTPSRVLQIAASIQQCVIHPIADAIVHHHAASNCNDKEESGLFIAAETVRTVPGRGVSAENVSLDVCGLAGVRDTIRIGGQWIDSGAESTQTAIHEGGDCIASTSIFMHCASLGGVFGRIDLQDELTCSTSDIRELRGKVSSGALVLLSGDSQLAVDAIAGRIGISIRHGDTVVGGLTPDGKVKAMKLVSGGNTSRILAVGDGVNDGPLLAQAGLGIAVGRLRAGCESVVDVAASAAGVLIPRGGIAQVNNFLYIARKCRIAMLLSIAWASGYNVLALLTTSGVLGVFVPAHVAASAMAVSSSIVVVVALILSLLLRRHFMSKDQVV